MTRHSPALDWAPPGPGAWTHDPSHRLRPVCRLQQDVFWHGATEGFRSYFARIGAPVQEVAFAWVHGWEYQQVRIVGAPPPGARRPPPAPVLRLLTRVHPELRRRDRAARRMLDDRQWVPAVRAWFGGERDRWVHRLDTLQATDPATLGGPALRAHVGDALGTAVDGLRRHFDMGENMLAVALALEAATAAGLPLERALAGVRSTRPAGIESPLDRFARHAAEPGRWAWRLGPANDLAAPCLAEDGVVPDPAALVGAAGGAVDPTASHDLRAAVRDDELTDLAGLGWLSAEDQAGITASWATGLVRRAALAAGAALAAEGRLEDPSHAFSADAGELVALLGGDIAAPPAGELARRHHELLAAAAVDPPEALGPPAPPPPDPSMFPAGLGRITSALLLYLQVKFGGPQPCGVGDRPHTARAVVEPDPVDALSRIQDGDVLVTSMTTPAAMPALGVAGALVTSSGGPASHPAVAARELGIPAVVGLTDALTRIQDGDEVTVDPRTATVTVH